MMQSTFVSASEKDGTICVTIANTSYDRAAEIELSAFAKTLGAKAVVTTLAAEPHAHNTFDDPDAVKPAADAEYALTDGTLALTVPAAGVVRVLIS